MALTRKRNSGNKKELGKRELGKKETGSRKAPVKNLALVKDKKDAAKKDKKDAAKGDKKGLALIKDKISIAKKDSVVKKEKVNYIEQARKFIRGALNELKKVHWPTRREIIIYTAVVLVAVVAVGVMIWLFDSALSFILKRILQR